jgi:diacylglycerol kinase (CTP)
VITELKKKSDLHLIRKIWHMGGVLVLYFIWVYLKKPFNLYIFIALWFVFVPVDFLRMKFPQVNKIFSKIFQIIMRASELNHLAGTTYLLTSTVFIALLFPFHVVSLSLLFLAFADPLASFVGIKWGRRKIFGHKSIEGFSAAFLICTTVTYLYLGYFLNFENKLLVSVLAGACGALAELVPIRKLDDNFTMPILSSVSLYFLFIVFNIF